MSPAIIVKIDSASVIIWKKFYHATNSHGVVAIKFDSSNTYIGAILSLPGFDNNHCIAVI